MHTNFIYTDYIFESSWEVAIKVGGNYTVLSSRANTLQKEHKDKSYLLTRLLGRKRKSMVQGRCISTKEWKDTHS